MIRVTLKSLLGHKLRFALTGLAIALGVAFMAGTSIFTATLHRGFDDLVDTGLAGTDVVVRSPEAFRSNWGEQREPVDITLLDRLRRVDGVAAGDVSIEGYAQMVDGHGDAVKTPGGNAPTLGMNWIDDAGLNSWNVTTGHPPRSDDEIVVDARSAKQAGFVVGDHVTVLTQAGSASYRLAGIAKWGEIDTPMGATVVLFTRATAQQVVGQPGKAGSIGLVAASGVSQTELRDRVAAALRGSHLEVLTGRAAADDAQDAIRQSLSFIDTFLLVFALIALFVGSFIIFNTFSITVAQRQRETALLRAIGASRRQVVASVLVEAAIVGALAGAAGLVLGVGLSVALRALLAGFGLELPSVGLRVSRSSLLPAFVAGTVVTLVAAALPARRASRIPPVAALRDVAVERNDRRLLRAGLGGIVLLVGSLALAFGLFADVDDGLPIVGGGLALVFLGVAALGPTFAGPLTRFLGAPLELRGMTGHLARENARRNPRRTSATASALMIGVALVSVMTILAASTKASVSQQIDGSMRADFVVTTGGMGLNGFSPVLSQRLQALPAVAETSGSRIGQVQVEGSTQFVTGVNPAAFAHLWDLGDVRGDLARLSDTGLAVSRRFAEDHGWHLGDAVRLRFARTGVDVAHLEAVYDEGSQVGDLIVNMHAYDRNFVQSLDNRVWLRLADGVSLSAGRAAIEPLLRDFPNVDLQDREELKSAIGRQVDQMLNLVYALLALAIVIALIGIANTLALSIHERTRELGLLRAVGLTRRQVRAAVRWEALLIAVLGTALGLGVGGLMGWALVIALHDQGMSVLSLPVTQLAIISVVGALAGVLAAFRPSQKAARLDVLRAISTE